MVVLLLLLLLLLMLLLLLFYLETVSSNAVSLFSAFIVYIEQLSLRWMWSMRSNVKERLCMDLEVRSVE